MKSTRKIEFGFELLRIVAAIILAYALALIVLIAITDEPLEAVKMFAFGPFSTKRRFFNIIELAIPFMFTGTCMCFMYSANRFNLVGEGAFLFSGCITTLLAIKLEPLGIPSFLFPALLIVCGGIIGACIAFVPAILRQKLNANEVVVAIMMNYALLYLSNYILRVGMRDKAVTYNASTMIPTQAKLVQFLPGTRLHTGIFVALFAVMIAVVILYKTSLGYSIRVCGINPDFAKYSGISVAASMVVAQMLGGMMAGMGGSVEILGIYDRFQWDNLTQYGFDGLLVAVLAHKNPIFVPLSAFLLAYLRIGADVVNRSTDVPAEFVSVLQAIIILLIAAQMFLGSIKNKVIFKNARAQLKEDKA
ncbi:MAG: ABC transporter permease [Oscillospiraceae bacterium]|nr:ABC transporter permease [Oscillospiraceae bacterium]